MSLLTQAADKRLQIQAWIDAALTLRRATQQRLKQITKPTCLRNWSQREALYDQAQRMPTPGILVRLDPRRAALFAKPAAKADFHI